MMTMRLLGLLVVLTGCGGGGKWLDVPGTGSNDCKDLEKSSKDAAEATVKFFGQQVCVQASMNYAGEYRCGDGIQVRCK